MVGGTPERQLALAYAKAIGADVVIYAMTSSIEKYNYTVHYELGRKNRTRTDRNLNKR